MAGQDVPMNGFAPVTDAAYFYAEAADGSQVKILKSNLMDLIKSLVVPVTKRILWAPIPNYGLTLTHIIHPLGCVRFDVIQNFFGAGTISKNAVCVSVIAELSFKNTPRVKVTTTGGLSHPMDNQGCSIAYKVESEMLYIYSPSQASFPLTVIEYFSDDSVELVSESYQTVDNLILIPISGN